MSLPHPPQSVFDRATEVTIHLRSSLPLELQHPYVAIVCGSGLGGLQHTIEPSPRAEFTYESLPHFPVSTGEWLFIPTSGESSQMT